MEGIYQLLISKLKLSKTKSEVDINTLDGDSSSSNSNSSTTRKMMIPTRRRKGGGGGGGGGMLARNSSWIAGLMFLLAMIQQYFPYELRRHLVKYIHRFISFVAYPYIQISFHEFTRDRLRRNEAYASVEAYLAEQSATNLTNTKRLKAETIKNQLVLRMEEHEMCSDEFCGAQVSWSLNKTKLPSTVSYSYPIHYEPPEKRCYRLTFHKRYRELITDSYLDHVVKEGRAIMRRNRHRKLFTNSHNKQNSMWSHVAFEHPASFQTLAMDPEMKKDIVDDLLTFSKSKDYYAKIGKAWKRGYLLYGPPGTGKSTMIAAMAKLLDYNVYDLELTAVKDNTSLRELLIEVSNKSILVIEDIDCSLHLTGQRKKKSSNNGDDKEWKNIHAGKKDNEENSSKVTLSGLLNFIDGLWSSCGEERLIILTTNYLEKLDPALIRRGRMDKHIQLSYCSFEAFKVLAKNYLDLEYHPLFETIQQLINKNKMTPADVAENLMPKSTAENIETCLTNLIRALEAVKGEEQTGPIEKRKEETDGLKDNKEEANQDDKSVLDLCTILFED